VSLKYAGPTEVVTLPFETLRLWIKSLPQFGVLVLLVVLIGLGETDLESRYSKRTSELCPRYGNMQTAINYAASPGRGKRLGASMIASLDFI
jgi:hypothetical protein